MEMLTIKEMHEIQESAMSVIREPGLKAENEDVLKALRENVTLQ